MDMEDQLDKAAKNYGLPFDKKKRKKDRLDKIIENFGFDGASKE